MNYCIVKVYTNLCLVFLKLYLNMVGEGVMEHEEKGALFYEGK